MPGALSYAVHQIALRTGLSVRLARRQVGARILMFHAVGAPRRPLLELPTMRIYSASQIERQLKYIRRHFSVVSIATLLAHVCDGEDRPSGEVALTFDDGLCCHFLWVYPVLQRLGLPATFFVCPGLADTGCWQSTYDIQLRLLTLPDDGRVELLRELGAPPGSVASALYWLAVLPLSRRLEIENVIRAQTSVFRPTAEQEAIFRPMNWAEMRTLNQELVTIGSHSMTHPSLPTLDPTMLDAEVRGSRSLLEDQLQTPVEYFCYPDGHTSQSVIEAVGDSYRGAVTTIPGLVLSGSDRRLLPRFGAGEDPLATEVWRLGR